MVLVIVVIIALQFVTGFFIHKSLKKTKKNRKFGDLNMKLDVQEHAEASPKPCQTKMSKLQNKCSEKKCLLNLLNINCLICVLSFFSRMLTLIYITFCRTMMVENINVLQLTKLDRQKGLLLSHSKVNCSNAVTVIQPLLWIQTDIWNMMKIEVNVSK